MSNLTTIGDGPLWVSGNPVLGNIDGLQNIDSASINMLYIVENAILSDCAIESVCGFLTVHPNGVMAITGNAPGCNSWREVQENCPLAIEDISMENDFTVSPNPLAGNAILKFNLSEPESISIEIYNPSGISVKSQYLQLQQPGQQEVNIDLSAGPPGIYILRINIANEIITRKIVKY